MRRFETIPTRRLVTFLLLALLAAGDAALAVGALRTLRASDGGAAAAPGVIVTLPAEAWSRHDAAELDRLRDALRAGSKGGAIVCRRADDGHPWCSLRDDKDPDRVLVHLARADRAYVLLWPQEGRWERIEDRAAAPASRRETATCCESTPTLPPA